jgi:hypothetical protein
MAASYNCFLLAMSFMILLLVLVLLRCTSDVFPKLASSDSIYFEAIAVVGDTCDQRDDAANYVIDRLRRN